MILEMVFPLSWLDAKSPTDPRGRPNRETATADYRQRVTLTRPQTFLGHISQMAAGLTHHVRPAQLRHISRSVPKTLILTGDDDHLVNPKNSAYLKAHMPEAEYVVWENTGHAIHMQHKARFNELLEKVFQEGRQRVEAGWTPSED